MNTTDTTMTEYWRPEGLPPGRYGWGDGVLHRPTGRRGKVESFNPGTGRVSLVQFGGDAYPTVVNEEDLEPVVSPRDRLAQETAEYIAENLTRSDDRGVGIEVHYVDERRPPTTVEDIKAALLDGRIWISWFDDRVIDAMRKLHGEPGDLATATLGEAL